MDKSLLINFIDAMVSGDIEASDKAIRQYTSQKAKFIADGAKETITETSIQEEFQKLLETYLADNVRLEGNTVYVNNKEVGKLKYTGEDEFGEGSQLVFVYDHGQREITIPDNSPEELAKFIRKKFLGEQE